MLKTRVAGIVSAALSVWYLSWLLQVLNWQQPILAVGFAFANIFLVVLRLVSTVNTWRESIPQFDLLDWVNLPYIATIITTVNEPLEIVEATVRSVLAQNYPHEKRLIIISDDGRRKGSVRLADRLQLEFPGAMIIWNHPEKHGNYKAGNLNSALALINSFYSWFTLIETRDCDDLVLDLNCTWYAVSLLASNLRLAYVQTAKEYRTSKGDPGGNQERTFYFANQITRNAANAVLVCGSGVFFVKVALDEIGGFVITGPVEDFRTGIAILSNGGEGAYLPVVGAQSYYPPEDVGVIIKQRAIWALDTQQWSFWHSVRTKGLSLAQRLHFLELSLFYWFSLPVIIFMLTLLAALVFRVYPLVSNHLDYAIHFWPFFVALEVHMALVNKRVSFEDQWRSRQIVISMAPVFAMACVRAILNGPNKRPAYKVTRKTGEFKFYWREAAPQWILTLSLIGALLFHLKKESLFFSADLGSMVWAVYFVLAMLPLTLGSLRGVGVKDMAVMAMNQSRSAVKWATLPRFALVSVVLFMLVGVSVTLLLSIGNIGEARGILSSVNSQAFTLQSTPIPEPIVTQLGIYNPNSPYDDFANIVKFQTDVGLPLHYILWFQAMGDDDRDFKTDWVLKSAELGLTPVITLEPWKRDFDNRKVAQPKFTFTRIVAGDFDQYFSDWADAAKAAGVEVIFRFAQEQSTDLDKFLWYPWQGDPEGFKAAYQHIVGIFRARGADNVKHIWSGMWIDADRAWLYYPGDEWVDMIGTTVLNHGTAVPNNKWASFDDLYRLQYEAVIKRTTKPIMITELGCAEQGGSKGKWLADMTRLISTDFPQTQAVLLLETTIDREWPAVNWSVTSSQDTLEIFRATWQQYFGLPPTS